MWHVIVVLGSLYVDLFEHNYPQRKHSREELPAPADNNMSRELLIRTQHMFNEIREKIES